MFCVQTRPNIRSQSFFKYLSCTDTGQLQFYNSIDVIERKPVLKTNLTLLLTCLWLVVRVELITA